VTLYQSLAASATVVPVRSREDAMAEANVRALRKPSAIFLHGGMMHWLVETLHETPTWHAILAAVERGASLAGTSGGMCCLGTQVIAPGEPDVDWVPGLGVLKATFGAHWDNPDFAFIRNPTERLASGERVVAVDEHTAMIGDGANWSGAGKGAIHVIQDGRENVYNNGDRFELPLR
jgi:cyanophycinase-like exopeptidase